MNQDREFDAVNAPLEGINLVEAAAGTGKTYNIQTLTIRAVLEKSIPMDSIMLVTFTKLAAAELKSRIFAIFKLVLDSVCGDTASLSADEKERAGNLIQKAKSCGLTEKDIQFKLRQAILDFDRAKISTIHSFCADILRDYAFECGSDFDFEILQDDNDLLARTARDFCRNIFFVPAENWGRENFFNWKNTNDFTNCVSALIRNTDAGIRVPEKLEGSFESNLTEIKRLFAALKEAAENDPVKNFLPDYFKKESLLKESDFWKKFTAICNGDSIKKDEWKYIFAVSLETLTSLANKRSKKQYEHISATAEKSQLVKYCTAIFRHYRQCQGHLLADARKWISEKTALYKTRHKLLSNDDLIRKSVLALETSTPFAEKLQQKFKFAIVDEFQDTDPLQCRMLDKIFFSCGTPIFMVGDPRQAIYKFRGCDLGSYLDATQKADNRYTLSRNYRSAGQLIACFNHFFGGHKCAFGKKEFQLPHLQEPQDEDKKRYPLQKEDGTNFAPLQIVMPKIRNDVDNYPHMVADIIANLLQQDLYVFSAQEKSRRSLQLSDITILVRKWDQAKIIRNILEAYGFPTTTIKADSIFASPEALDILRFLRAVLHPGNRNLASASLLGNLTGKSVDLLLDASENEKSEYLTLLEKFLTVWKNEGFALCFQKILDEFNIFERYSRMPEGAKRLAAFTGIGNILRQQAHRNHLSPAALTAFLAQAISEKSSNAEAFPESIVESSNAIKIMTMHAAKGLQFNVTICTYLDEKDPAKTKSHSGEIYYDQREKCKFISLSPTEEDKAALKNETFEEELRLAYVALTRAVNCCIVAGNGIIKNQKSDYASVLDYLIRNRENDCSTGYAVDIAKNDLPINQDIMHFIYLPPSQMKVPYSPQAEKCELAVRDFSASPDQNWKISSFSSLALHNHQTGEIPFDLPENDEKENASGNDNLPRLSGAWYGDLIHSTLENMDFSCDLAAIRERVARYLTAINADENEISYTASLLFNAVNTPISDIRLCDIPASDRVAERRFTFALKNPLNVPELFTLADLEIPDNGSPVSGGFLTGSIDLLFRKDGKFFIADWKSNRLADYSQETLLETMRTSSYSLQLLIYMVALVKFLMHKKVFDVFDANAYECFCGGAYYLFLRGMSPSNGGNGIFFHRPDFETVKAAMELLK